MQYQFSYRDMKPEKVLQDYAEKRITQKVEKFITKPKLAEISFLQQGKTYIIHCKITAGDRFSCQAEAKSEDKLGAVDFLAGKLEVQLKRQKEKLKDHRPRNSKTYRNNRKSQYDDCDKVPIDAEDLIKYEKARLKIFG